MYNSRKSRLISARSRLNNGYKPCTAFVLVDSPIKEILEEESFKNYCFNGVIWLLQDIIYTTNKWLSVNRTNTYKYVLLESGLDEDIILESMADVGLR